MANLPQVKSAQLAQDKTPDRLRVCIFSKHLQWLNWERMAATAAELGFDGVDVTVRNGGHVLPQRVEEDLPKVVEIVRKAGLDVPMITAEIVDAHSPHAENIVRTASGLGIHRYRWGWFSWFDAARSFDISSASRSTEEDGSLFLPGGLTIPQRLTELKKRVRGLAELNKKYEACAMYHNHHGPMVGASLWDLWLLIKDFDPRWVSSNFDIAQATIEGGVGGWINSARLLRPFIKGTAIKDFKWGKNARGDWEPHFCPLGEGMVHFKRYFAMLKEAKFSGPMQVHFEYPLGGAEDGKPTLTTDKSEVLAAMRRDLSTLRGWLSEARLT